MTKSLRVGVAGLGTVGSAVVRWLMREKGMLTAATNRDISVVAVSARDKNRARDISLDHVAWENDPAQLAKRADVDLFIELIGGEDDPAYTAVKTALSSGKAVITANKALMAKHGMELATLAEAKGVPLSFEASAAGAVPVIRLLRDAYGGQPIDRIRGILNGTCNYILSKMEDEGIPFEQALAEAQSLGYAEADPAFDIDGYDTAHKLTLLTSLAFGVQIKPTGLEIRGIRNIKPLDLTMAAEFGCRVKLLGTAERTVSGLVRRVAPIMLQRGTPIAETNGVLNAVAIKATHVPEQTIIGPGAGGDATASSVVSDVVDIARGFSEPPFGRPTHLLGNVWEADPGEQVGCYYIRMLARDRVGVAASVATRMAEQGISIETILFRHLVRKADDPSIVPIILITHQTTYRAVEKALRHIASEGHIDDQSLVMRLERE